MEGVAVDKEILRSSHQHRRTKTLELANDVPRSQTARLGSGRRSRDVINQERLSDNTPGGAAKSVKSSVQGCHHINIARTIETDPA